MEGLSEQEWLRYHQSNTGNQIKQFIVEAEEEISATDRFKQMMVNDEIECDGECNDCGCAELENEFISHPKAEAQARKETPVYSGVLNYFPDAIKAIAQCSFIGNEQHNPNTPLHWDRSKSGDEKDALMRHLLDAGTVDTDDIRHSTKVAWRALANLQKEIENDRK